MVRRKVVYIFPNLIAEMSRNGDSLQSVSNELGMNYQALSARLRGFKSFELPEITFLMKKYRKRFEYLFEVATEKSAKGA